MYLDGFWQNFDNFVERYFFLPLFKYFGAKKSIFGHFFKYEAFSQKSDF